MTAHSKELNSERLMQLSSEVSRIANTLASLSTDSVMPEESADTGPNGSEPAPEISAQTVGAAIRARRLRARFFDEELFADPAWDMMLHLLYADLRQQRVTISTLCAAAHVPATTALRWLKSMSDKGVFIRRDDPFDGRRTYVELAPATERALRFYFAELAKGSTF